MKLNVRCFNDPGPHRLTAGQNFSGERSADAALRVKV